MSITPRNRLIWKDTHYTSGGNPGTFRSYWREQRGWNSTDKTVVLSYFGFTGRSTGFISYPGVPEPARYPRNAETHRILWMMYNGLPSEITLASNSAYAEFKNAAVGDNSSLGATFAEWRQSLGMIANRSIQIGRAARSLRKGDFNGFVTQLGVRPKRKHRRKPPRIKLHTDVSGLWLEYWFGWAPLYGDIFGAADIIGQPIPSGSASGTGGSTHYSADYSYGGARIIDIRLFVKCGADILLVNPNLFLAQRVGLLNPATIAWEVLPFSFCLDWAFGVSNFIESFTDFAGCELSNSYTTTLLKGTDVAYDRVYGGQGRSTISGDGMLRNSGIPQPMPNWHVLANLKSSITRAASAASLLTQSLSRLRG